MSATTKYELHGPGIEITYRQGDLSVNGDRPYLQERHFTADGRLQESSIGIGQVVTAVLDGSLRVGSEVLLTLLLPEADPQDGTAGEEATGVAVITNQGGLSGSVEQRYEVRPLAGSVSRIAS